MCVCVWDGERWRVSSCVCEYVIEKVNEYERECARE